MYWNFCFVRYSTVTMKFGYRKVGKIMLIDFILGIVINVIAQIATDYRKSIFDNIRNCIDTVICKRKYNSTIRKVKRWLWGWKFAVKCFLFPDKYLTEEGKKSRWKIWKFRLYY